MALQYYSKLLIGITIGGQSNKLKTVTMVMRIPEKRSTCHCYLWEQAAKSSSDIVRLRTTMTYTWFSINKPQFCLFVGPTPLKKDLDSVEF